MTTTKKTTTKTRKPRSFSVKKPLSLELPKNPFMFEVLDLVSKQRTKAKKIEVLKKYEELPLKVILIWNFALLRKVCQVKYSKLQGYS